jgi:hypothetical protein
LKKQKEDLTRNFGKSEADAERNQKMLQNYLKVLERKKNEFNKFMDQKGKEALAHVKRTHELKEQMKEEIKKIETKKKVKTEEIKKAHQVARDYREILEQKEEVEEFEEPGVCYKVNQAFHNMGNRIDYTTTRFHNIMVYRHNEDDLEDFISAQEKAEREIEKNETRHIVKTQGLREFNNETKVNSMEIMKKIKTKENLQQLEKELDRIRKKSKNKVVM